MFAQIVRTAAGLTAAALRFAPRVDPDFSGGTWVVGVAPGSLISASQVRAVGLGTRAVPAEAWRIEYATSNARRRVLSATGAVFRSRVPWAGNGPRPTVAFAPSTQGVAPRCDPSYSCTVGAAVRTRPFDVIAAYEQPVINLLVALGCNVVLTDYPRDPQDNVQYYCDHATGARALADAVRASSRLGIDPINLGLWGFSQGGGAVGAWLEQPEYAPELQPLAAVVGAPPADLPAVLRHVDGTLPVAVVVYCAAGMMAADPDVAAELSPMLTDEGLSAIAFSAKVCAPGAVAGLPYLRTERLTTTGLPLGEVLDRFPRSSTAMDRMGLGHRTPPEIPILLWATRRDDVIPYSVPSALARAWGRRLRTYPMPRIPGRTGANHFLPYFLTAPRNAQWLLSHLGR